MRGPVRIARGLRLRSLRLGLVGQADVVEFHKVDSESNGIPLEGIPGFWKPYIIEYKRGKPKIGREDEVQLCAQAFCLEEMLGITLSTSSFFYGLPKRRHEVALNAALRQETEKCIALLHELSLSGKTPAPEYTPACRSCSLVDVCLPRTFRSRKNIQKYLSLVKEDAHETPA